MEKWHRLTEHLLFEWPSIKRDLIHPSSACSKIARVDAFCRVFEEE